MSHPIVVLSADVGRIHAASRARRIFAPIRDALAKAGAHVREGWKPEDEDLPWADWMRFRRGRFFDGFWRDADFVLGWEAPLAWLNPVGAWVNFTSHPLRLAGFHFAAETNHTLIRHEFASHRIIFVDHPPRLAEYTSFGVFICQVGFDASLFMDDGRFATWAEFAPGVAEWAHQFETVYVCPHPEDPRGPWPRAVLDGIPNAQLSPWPTMETLQRVPSACTLSSSAGIEAETMGVNVRWLLRRPYAGPLIPASVVADPNFWRQILALL